MINRQEILDYVEKRYNTKPEQLFAKHPTYSVLRNEKSKKWYGIVMNIEKRKIGINEEGNTDIINIKGNPEFNSILRSQSYILPAYHMNKRHWITVILNNECKKEELFELIDWSYQLTK